MSYVRAIVFGAIIGSIAVLVLTNPGSADPQSKTNAQSGEPLFVGRFTEVPSERTGFRKFSGWTKRVVISGTLLGIVAQDVSKSSPPPAGTFGSVAIGHTIFYRAKDFKILNLAEGTSVLYVPERLPFPAELIRVGAR